MSILYAGDPHGNFTEIEAIWKKDPKTPTIFLGDQGCPIPFSDIIKNRDAYYIMGNHDGDDKTVWQNQYNPEKDLNGRIVEINGVRYAGLGGVFRGKIWLPKSDKLEDVPSFKWEEIAQPKKKKPANIEQISCRHRVSIWPQYVLNLAQQKADILITHEAPYPHQHGFGILNTLAKAMGVKRIVHGHHHIDYKNHDKENNLEIYGVGIGAVWENDHILIPGRYQRES